MLYWVESLQRVTKMPFQREYERWKALLTPDEIAAIKRELNAVFDSGGIHTAGWIPGDDWADKVYAPIYDKPAQRNYDLAARIFGLVVFETAMERPDKWVTGRFEKNGVPIGSRTYFRPGDERALTD